MRILGLLLILCFAMTSCQVNKDQLKEMLKKNPDILTEAIQENPDKFIEALNAAVKSAQSGQAKKRQEDEKKQLEESFNNPLKPQIRADEMFRGDKNAEITLIEYSDFECPYCKRGYTTVMELMEKYKGKIRFVYKHLPLSFHPNAMPASQYYEALRIQKEDYAAKFHDELYENQGKLRQGEKFFKAVAKKIGADMAKLAKDVKSDAVKKRIEEDLAEARKYGFNGTPGFLINGVPVKGAYPASHFDGIIEELKKRGKIK
jgi:protein-disulfide isomerase